MSFHVSPAASDRTKQTIHAAELIHDNARLIAAACVDAAPDELVVVVVDRGDMALAGVWTVAKDELTRRVPELDTGWALVFSPGTTADEIEERALQMARLAFARWEAMRRWVSRHE